MAVRAGPHPGRPGVPHRDPAVLSTGDPRGFLNRPGGPMASLAPRYAHTRVVRRYLAALHAGDSAAIVRLFSPAGEVVSPFLGRVPAEEFFAKLAAASRRSDIEVLDVLMGTSEAPRA